MYRILWRIARIAVQWYYRDVEIDGADRIPRDGPVRLVTNHPNELLDALFAGLVPPRQLTFTGKATLFDNPVIGAFLRHMCVVPLRRVQDERAIAGAADRARRADRLTGAGRCDHQRDRHAAVRGHAELR